ncbi:3'(2'),5'-bisphosphate nucleotidase CysQ [Aestuariivirga litoralis]|uniref:3'(2'),5'-bisphosphate nucleotidase CysQ n=1 Tax=Aestuariivirga litoralis TaxID=2650924 RepID=UPI0018C4F5B2|nr:3'(2'),5'-bisphosphate nucleotidase CysQ [Aestuariivirga litoralis]MBG1230915.1 3'(2'),5'-bisphosphate nucleotidase CysQ [Aestuariivirga litoralis]
MTSFTQDLQSLGLIAHEAAKKVMEIYNSDFTTETKADASPVTAADTAAEAIILKGLAQHFPDIPVIAEEEAAAGKIPAIGSRFFLVDPVDGTREFISRNGEFTVNIGLIENGVPIMGVVYAPALDELYMGATGHGAFRGKINVGESFPGMMEAIATRACPAEGPVILASRSHRDPETESFIAAQKPSAINNAGSSLKFCRLAEGAADLYPRFGRTMEWDTAAGHAVLLAAGGQMAKADGTPFLYGKQGFANPPFVARGR